MAQSATTGKSRIENNVTQRSRTNDRMPSTSIATTCCQTNAIKTILSQHNAKSDKSLFVDQIPSEHFADLIELAIQLDLNEDVEQLFSSQSPNVTAFMELLTTSLLNTVQRNINQDRITLIQDMCEHIQKNGMTIDKTRLSTLFFSFADIDFGGLRVGINTSDNTNFDETYKVNLCLESDNADALFLLEQKNPLALSVLNVIKKNSENGLIISSTEALLNYMYGYAWLYDELADKLEVPDFNLDETVDYALENIDLAYGYDMNDTDEESKKEGIEQLKEDISILAEICGQGRGIGSTFLSQWFESRFKPLDHDAYTRLSYWYPCHFLISDKFIYDEINNAYESINEECEFRMKIHPVTAIETLTTIARNRNLITLYDALCYLGNEDNLNQEFREKNNIQITDNPFF